MNFFILYLLSFFYTTVELHWPMSLRDFKTNRTNFPKCLLQDTSNGVGAGAVRNLTAKCHYHSKHPRKSFYYQLSWSHPKPTGTPVTGYRVKIVYELSKYVCFRLPASQSTFLFNQSMGLVYGCGFQVYVTPQPILRVDGIFYQQSTHVTGCPVAPKLLSFPNLIVHPGSNSSFIVAFDEEPVPRASISWHFSSDLVNCKNLRIARIALGINNRNIIISEDGTVLKILNVSRRHVGCYVAIAWNGVGRRSKQRGYLSLNTTTQHSVPQGYNRNIEKVLVALLAGLMTILILLLLIFKYKPQTATPNNDVNITLITKTIYLSHCMEDKDEREILAQFAEALKRFGITIVVDVFSQMEIHNAGGLSRWIPEKMMEADKIVVLLTQAYTLALGSIDERAQLEAPSECTKKIHSESVYMNSISYNKMHNSTRDIVVVTKGIKKGEIPCVFKPGQLCKFPKVFDVAKDSHFRTILEILRDQ